jgi:hypothetical protein
MRKPRTTLKLTVAALGVVALFGAAAAAGVDRGQEMRASGISVIAPGIPAADSAANIAPART